jgi:hypothetical protein
MKNLIKFLVIVLCISTLTGCSSTKKPKGLEDKLYDIAKETIQITDDYLDRIATGQETQEKSIAISRNNYNYFQLFIGGGDDVSKKDINYSVYVHITELINILKVANSTILEDKVLLKYRNELAELINKKKK